MERAKSKYYVDKEGRLTPDGRVYVRGVMEYEGNVIFKQKL